MSQGSQARVEELVLQAAAAAGSLRYRPDAEENTLRRHVPAIARGKRRQTCLNRNGSGGNTRTNSHRHTSTTAANTLHSTHA